MRMRETLSGNNFKTATAHALQTKHRVGLRSQAWEARALPGPDPWRKGAWESVCFTNIPRDSDTVEPQTALKNGFSSTQIF